VSVDHEMKLKRITANHKADGQEIGMAERPKRRLRKVKVNRDAIGRPDTYDISDEDVIEGETLQ